MSAGASLGKAKVVRATDKALLVQLESEDEGQPRWIPRSQVHDDSEVFDDKGNAEGELVVSEWFANKEGLI